MNNSIQWIKSKVLMGCMFLAAGTLVAMVGIFIRFEYAYLPYNTRIITGSGILLIGIGVASLVRYGTALKDEQSAKRLTVEERDERTVLIRARAGNKAFWVSTGLIYIGLMWASFAVNGAIPALSGDTLWFFLAACLLIPFGTYITSILIDQRNL
jgi:hypothetical protein